MENKDPNARVIALGFFDGVHLGHAALLERCRQEASRRGCAAAALTFDTHPDNLVFGQPVGLINTPADRAFLMRSLFGMDEILTLRFDRAMMTMPWEDFITRILVDTYHACHVVCGHDFRFGDHGRGTAAGLKKRCAQLGLGCDVVEAVKLDGTTVSSTHIRALLEAGDMENAGRFLGHPHILTGPVVSGRRLGRTIGIPTANLHLPEQLLCPARGVYACKAVLERETYLAVTNIGVRPTVGGHRLTVEPWLLDFDGDLYGRQLRLEFYKFLRPERKFDSIGQLKAAVLENARQTRKLFEPRRV